MVSMKAVVTELYPLHRTLVSDGTDLALEIIGKHLSSSAEYHVETYESNTQAWTWRVPERYVVHEAYLETDDGLRVADFSDNPLHLVSYSVPVDRWLTWEELEPHLYYSDRRPQAIPWEYKYYERSWGFCLTKCVFERLPRDAKYHAVIRSEFVVSPDRGLRVGVATVHPKGGEAREAGLLMFCTDVCHPYQVNDSITGVAVAIEVASRFVARPLPEGSMGIRFIFVPETIGSICYLSRHEELIPFVKGGIFCEMVGHRASLLLQRSFQDNHLIDRVARYVLKKRGTEFREGAFIEFLGNDEQVINGPGVNVPCISITRWPYDEYHTSDDNPDIVHEDMLLEAADVVEEILRTYASNYVPVRTFRGPVFLSGFGLWVDPRENAELNRALRKLMCLLEGTQTIFDIGERLGLDFWVLRNYVEALRQHRLVEIRPVGTSPAS